MGWTSLGNIELNGSHHQKLFLLSREKLPFIILLFGNKVVIAFILTINCQTKTIIVLIL